MKKKFLGLAAVTAALTMATGIQAFAAGWTQDSEGWYYVYPSGYAASMGWFTDPDTGLIYYIDPDGHIMTHTHVEGYWLDDNGVRQEKSEEELQREAEKKASEAKKPTPNKDSSKATDAGKAAVNAVAAVKTTRLQYQAEMKTFANKALQGAWKNMSAYEENADLKKVISDTSVELTYKINQDDGCTMISTSNWLMSNPKNVDYKEEAFTLTYIPNHIRTATQGTEVGEAFHTLVVAALGETEGASVYDEVTAQIQASAEKYERSGQTDSGNSYNITFRYGIVTLNVTVSGVDAEAEAEAAEWEAEQAAKAAEKAAKQAAKEGTTETVTSSVIVAGQASAAEETTEETAEETTTEETDSTDESAETDTATDTETEADA